MARGRASPSGAPTVLDHPGLGRRLVLLLVRRGPRAFWAGMTHAPYKSSLRFGFSTVAKGYRAQPDVAVVLTPPGTVEPDPSIISPRQVRSFVRTVAPGAPSEPRLDALVALERKHRIQAGRFWQATGIVICGDASGRQGSAPTRRRLGCAAP